MTEQSDTTPVHSGTETLLSQLGKGRPLPAESGDALEKILGIRPSLDGLSRLFQPGFPGIRTFAIDVHANPDRTVQLDLVGIARDGRPVWTASRGFAIGRDGSLEIHQGFDALAPEIQARNITVDLIQRELDLLTLLTRGPSDRITADAELVGPYLCAVHGFVFADETEEGPPIRSARMLDSTSDREALIEAASAEIERIAQRRDIGRIAVEAALQELKSAQTPMDFARLKFSSDPEDEDNDAVQLGLTALGQELLSCPQNPPWRAALYRQGHDERCFQAGVAFRRVRTRQSETELAAQIQAAREELDHATRAVQVRSLKELGMIAPAWVLPEVGRLVDGADRRVAAVARQTIRQINGTDLPDRMLAFAYDTKIDPRPRATTLRVLAEHFPDRLEGRVSMLRVHPDARIQRAAVPLVAYADAQAEGLASMLAANPWCRNPSEDRPGLAALRLELIERLRTRADPRTLPCLMAALRAEPRPPPAEMLALSRALVAFSDPRAQTVLAETARGLERIEIP